MPLGLLGVVERVRQAGVAERVRAGERVVGDDQADEVEPLAALAVGGHLAHLDLELVVQGLGVVAAAVEDVELRGVRRVEPEVLPAVEHQPAGRGVVVVERDGDGLVAVRAADAAHPVPIRPRLGRTEPSGARTGHSPVMAIPNAL